MEKILGILSSNNEDWFIMKIYSQLLIILVVGIHSLLCGSVVEVLRAIVVTRLWDSGEAIGIIPRFFLIDISADGLWPQYYTYIELFSILYLIYLSIYIKVKFKSKLNFYIQAGVFYCLANTLGVFFCFIFLLQLHNMSKFDAMPQYTVTPIASIVHYCFWLFLLIFFFLCTLKVLNKIFNKNN